MQVEEGAPIRLHLGSGPFATPGWENVDSSPNTVLSRIPIAKRALRRVGVIDAEHMTQWDPTIIRKNVMNLDYPPRSVAAIYSSHMLEHLYLEDCERLLSYLCEILIPGGLLRLALPNSEEFARALINCDLGCEAEAAREFNRQLMMQPESQPTGTRRLLWKIGTHLHKWQPTFPLLVSMLEQAGFVDVIQRSFGVGQLPDLEVIETRNEGTFYVEALRASLSLVPTPPRSASD